MSIQGIESLFYIKYNGIFVPISCEVSSPISETAEMMETTTRDNQGWRTSKPTLQSYSITVDGLMKRDDYEQILSYRKLRKMKRERTLIEWQRRTIVGFLIDYGKAYISEISDSNTVGEEITFSMTLEGFGKPEENVISDNYYIYSDEITYNFNYSHIPENEANAGQWFLTNLLYNNYVNVFGIIYDCALKTKLTQVPVKGFLANNVTHQIYRIGDFISYCDKDDLVYYPNGFNNDLGVSGNFVEIFKYRIYDQQGNIGRETTHTINMTDIAVEPIDISVSITWADGTSTNQTGTAGSVNVQMYSLTFDPLNPIVTQQWEVWNGTDWVFYADKTTDIQAISLPYELNRIRLKVVAQYGEVVYSNTLLYTKTATATIYITDEVTLGNGSIGFKLHVEGIAFAGFVHVYGEKELTTKNSYIDSAPFSERLFIPSNYDMGQIAKKTTAVTIPVGVYDCIISAGGSAQNPSYGAYVWGKTSFSFSNTENINCSIEVYMAINPI